MSQFNFWYNLSVVVVDKENIKNVHENRYNIVTGGTDCHIVHVDLKRSPVAISGAKGELVLEEVHHISLSLSFTQFHPQPAQCPLVQIALITFVSP